MIPNGDVIIGKQLRWEDIKIGQAFYFEGCAGIGIKLNRNRWFCLQWQQYDGIFHSFDNFTDLYFYWDTCIMFKYYDLPKSLRQCLETI